MKLMSDIMTTKVNSKDIKEKIEILKNDPELKTLLNNIDIELYLPELLEYISNRDKCKSCRSITECTQETAGLRKNVSLEGGYLEFTVNECEYSKRDKRRKKIKIEAMHLPEKLLNISGKDIYKDPERKEILDYFNSYLKNSNEFNKGVYLSGRPGMGKTMMICALANELSNRGKSIILTYFPDLVRELRNSVATGTIESKIKSLKDIDVLVLDDIGGEKMSEFIRDEVLGPILNSRMLSDKATFFTSNYTMKELIKKYASQGEAVESLRIAERIKAMANEFRLEGKKYRK